MVITYLHFFLSLIIGIPMSNKDDDQESKVAEYMIENMQNNGISTMTVRDGHILLVKRSFLEELLSKHPNQPIFQIFLQKPTLH